MNIKTETKTTEELETPNFEQFFLNSTKKHPILYASSNYTSSALKVMDQTFNTIGNGCFNKEGLEKEHKVKKNKKQKKIDENHFNNVKVFEVFFDKKSTDNSRPPSRNCVNLLKGIFTEEQIEKLKKTKLNISTLEIEKNNKINFYQNFTEEYSVVHEKIFKDFDESWKKAALDFYKLAREYFSKGEFENDTTIHWSVFGREPEPVSIAPYHYYPKNKEQIINIFQKNIDFKLKKNNLILKKILKNIMILLQNIGMKILKNQISYLRAT